MMKKELLKLPHKKTISVIIFMQFFFISFICKSQVNIFSDIKTIESTHEIKDKNFYQVLDFILNDKDFINWKNQPKKLLLISSIERKEDTLIRVIPKTRESYSLSSFSNNNYTAYFLYKDIFIVYRGDDRLFFKPLKNKIKKELFIDNEKNNKKIEPELIIIQNKEYYGYDFQIKNNRVYPIEKNYFDKILIEEDSYYNKEINSLKQILCD